MKFVLFLVAVIIVGLSVGGAYGAGVAMGKREASAATPAAAASTATRAAGAPQAGQTGSAGSTAASSASGTPQARQNPEGTGTMSGRPAVTGTVQGIDGNTISIVTQEGTDRVTVKDGTTIQKMATVKLEDLQQGERLMVMGERNPDGTYAATAIQIVQAGRAESASPDQQGARRGQAP